MREQRLPSLSVIRYCDQRASKLALPSAPPRRWTGVALSIIVLLAGLLLFAHALNWVGGAP